MILFYYLAFELFLLPGIALVALIGKKVPFVLAKIVGAIFISLISWSICVIFHFPAIQTFLIILVVMNILSFIGILTKRILISVERKDVVGYVILTVVSLIIYSILNYIRTFKPEILGTEKFMDVALMETILKQNKLPIENFWMQGFLMNYYYVGHYLFSLISYISQTPLYIGYNLCISFIAILLFQISHTFYSLLTQKKLWPYLFSIITVFGGNLFLFYELIILRKDTSWFASATRVIPFTINEFPSYSIILGDIHGHYISIAFFCVGIILSFLFWKEYLMHKVLTRKIQITYGLLLGLVVAFVYLINSWDVITLFFFNLMCVLIFLPWKEGLRSLPKHLIQKFPLFIGSLGTISGLVYFLSKGSFLPPVSGIGVNHVFSSFLDIFLLFGQFLIMFLVFLIIALIYRKTLQTELTGSEKVFAKLSFLLVVTGLLLIIICELFFLKDVFSTLNPQYSRTNTVFKIYYHIWMLFSFGTFGLLAIFLPLVMKRAKNIVLSLIMVGILTAIWAIMLSYPVHSIRQFMLPASIPLSSERLMDSTYLDGTQHLKTHENDYEVLRFLSEIPHAVIAESTDYNSYSYTSRFSVYTGHTSVMGWPLHNVQWYNGYEGLGITTTGEIKKVEIASRVADMEKLYTTVDGTIIQDLINKYKIEYIVYGEKEQSYLAGDLKEPRLTAMKGACTIVFGKGTALVFKCDPQNNDR